MEKQLAKLGLVIINELIARAHVDSIAAEKIRNNEPLTLDDLKRLGDARDDAFDDLDDALEAGHGND